MLLSPPTLRAMSSVPCELTACDPAELARPKRFAARLPIPAAVTVLLLMSSALPRLRAMLSPRLPKVPEPCVVAVPLLPTWVAIPNNPFAEAVAASPSAIPKVNASPVWAAELVPSAKAAPKSPLALAVAPSPMAIAAPKIELVQPPPLPMPKIEAQVALAAGAVPRPVPARAAAHTPAATVAMAVRRAEVLGEVINVLKSAVCGFGARARPN